LCHASSPFCSGYFGNGVSWIVCLSWPRTMILPISASLLVARITGMSYGHLASTWILINQNRNGNPEKCTNCLPLLCVSKNLTFHKLENKRLETQSIGDRLSFSFFIW
jgi:hypothetical protein